MTQMTDIPTSIHCPFGLQDSVKVILGDRCVKIKTVQIVRRAYSFHLTLVIAAQPTPETPPALSPREMVTGGPVRLA